MLLRVLQRERRGGDITLDIDSEKFFKGKNRCRAFLLHSIQAENSSESSSVLVFVWPQRGHTTLLVSSPAPPAVKIGFRITTFFCLSAQALGKGESQSSQSGNSLGEPASIAARPPPLPPPSLRVMETLHVPPTERHERTDSLHASPEEETSGPPTYSDERGKKPSLRYEQGRLCSSLALSATFEEVTTTFRGSFVVQLSFFKK